MVIAVPVAAAVQWHEEHVRTLQRRESAIGVLGAKHRVAQRCGEAAEDARPEQEASRVIVKGVEHLGRQIVGDVAVVSRKLPDAYTGRIAVGKLERSQA